MMNLYYSYMCFFFVVHNKYSYVLLSKPVHSFIVKKYETSNICLCRMNLVYATEDEFYFLYRWRIENIKNLHTLKIMPSATKRCVLLFVSLRKICNKCACEFFYITFRVNKTHFRLMHVYLFILQIYRANTEIIKSHFIY